MRWLAMLLLTIVTVILSPFIVGVWVLLGIPIPWWMNTPDEPGPEQGMYEAQVAAVFAKYGQKVKTWYWLGIRNQMYGLFWKLSPQAPADASRQINAGDATITFDGKVFREWWWRWNWPDGKHYANPRIGWKVAEMDLPGPVVIMFQLHRLWLTIK